MKILSVLLVLAFIYYLKSKNDGNNGPGTGDDMGDYTGGAAAF